MKLLNLINFLKKNETIPSQAKGSNIRTHRRDIPMNKEWYNSSYSFNKNTIRTLPAIYNHTFKLFKWHFNMINNSMYKKMQSYSKMHRTSGNKLWVSNPEIKHYNNKVNITVYTYNNVYNYYKKKLGLLQSTWGPILTQEQILPSKNNLNKFRSWKQKFSFYMGTNKTVNNQKNKFYKKIIKWLKLSKYSYMYQYKSTLLDAMKNNNRQQLIKFFQSFKISNYNYLINQFNKELVYLKLKQKILFHEFKYSEISLSTIIELTQSIYKKKVELNIITLKYFWLSTSILLQILTAKVRNSKNRGKPGLPLNSAMNKIKVPILSKNKLAGEIKPYVGIQNVKLNEFNLKEKDLLNEFLLTNNKKSQIWSQSSIDDLVLTNLENKIIAGVFLKISGRLTKRYKAQRAVRKLRFKGTLKNVYSAHRNYSSSLSKGYSNINVEKVKINSNVRIGAFGITGWIASY